MLTAICPIRFRQNWIIAADAANFLFPQSKNWTTLSEVRLKDNQDNIAGNIDLVVVSYDDNGEVVDFGAVEIQSVYISGNLSNPFRHYMKAPISNHNMDWTNRENYPRPDYLSSTRKRLAPQLIYKGTILRAWNKKISVVVHESLYNTLPKMPEVSKNQADIAWHIYNFSHDSVNNVYNLVRSKTIYTKFKAALDQITQSEPGDIREFIDILQSKLNEKLPDLNHTPPTEEPDTPQIF